MKPIAIVSILIAANVLAAGAVPTVPAPGGRQVMIEDIQQATMQAALAEQQAKAARAATVFTPVPQGGPIPLVARPAAGPVVGEINPAVSREIAPGAERATRRAERPRENVLVLESAWGDDKQGFYPVVRFGEDVRELEVGNFIGPWRLARVDAKARCFHFEKTSVLPASARKANKPKKGTKAEPGTFTETVIRCANRATAIAARDDGGEK
jgi:hypothetical protein